MEDAQPNEVRLSRKGSTSVPRVRTSSRVPPFFSTRGRGSARIHGHPHSQHRHNARTVVSPVQTTQRAHHPAPTHPTVSLHQNHPSPHNSRPFKRIKLESSETPGSSPENASEQMLIQVSLPPECYKGVPRYHKTRQAWIQAQKEHIATERQLFVVGFKYLETERRVQFTCRTRHFGQSPPYDSQEDVTNGSRRANTQASAANSNATHKDAIAPGSLVSLPPTKHRDNQHSLDQSNVAGPSRAPPPICIRPTPRVLVDSSQHLENQSAALPSGSATQEMPTGTLSKMSNPVRRIRASPASQRWTTIRVEPLTEDIIDLTLDHPSPVAERDAARWTTFRSGTLYVSLPPLTSDSRFPEPAHGPNTRLSPSRTSGREASACIRDASSLSPQTDITISAFSIDNNRPAPSGLIHGNNTAGYSRDRPIVLEDEPKEPTQIRALAVPCKNLPLSLGPYDKPRRLLHDTASAYVVTAHGTIDQVLSTNTLNLERNIWSPSSPLEEFVDDACMLPHREESALILGHSREQNQLSLLKAGRGHAPRQIMLRRDWNTSKKPGVSAVAALTTPSQFVTGGYDHVVHLWDVAEDLSGASANQLSIRHTAGVYSLLHIKDTSHKLVSVGADCCVHLFDMSSERVGHSIKISAIPFHAHKTHFQFCTLLEVAHLDTQFELHDHRVVPDRPAQRFGFTAEEKHGRFMKGDSWSHFFLSGDRNGNVRLWDLRNVSTEVARLSCFRDQVMQVVKSGPRALACSRKNELACIDFQAG